MVSPQTPILLKNNMKEDLRQLREDFQRHLDADSERFEKIHELLQKLATKEDVKEVSQAFAAAKSVGSFVMWLAGIALAITALTGNLRSLFSFLFGFVQK